MSKEMTALLSMRQAEYLVVEAQLPGHAAVPIGVLLYDALEDRLDARLRRDWDRIAGDDEAEVLELLAQDLEAKTAELGAAQLLGWLEDTWSNSIRVSERRPVVVGNFQATLNRLYREHVPATVQPFRTHLPVYSLRAAAGRWGEQFQEQVEPQDWMEMPGDLRLTEGMFVTQVVGRSMEPQIADGSWCVFRAPVVGSRENKRVLVINRDESEEGGQRYTVKRYRSHKVRRQDGGWEHDWIRFEPLNPDFPDWEVRPGERVEVLAEFIRALD
jgi:phage repressor protein C with HTH and peptisase S24 domain